MKTYLPPSSFFHSAAMAEKVEEKSRRKAPLPFILPLPLPPLSSDPQLIAS